MKIINRILSLILTAGFAMQTIGTVTYANDESLQEIYNKILFSERFEEEEFLKVIGAFQCMRIEKAENISVDGNSADWNRYFGVKMPTLESQYQVYMTDGREKDVNATAKFAYDNENFYFFVSAEDDNHVYFTTEDKYWSGDGLQVAISGMEESYGTEIGMIHNTELNQGQIFGLSAEQSSKIKLSTSQYQTNTIYECAIPWDLKFANGMPEAFKFSIIINDNDGYGRRYCVELAPGIAEGKTNAEFPVLELANENKTWYGWTENDLSADMGEEIGFDSYIVNSSDEEQAFTVSATYSDKKEQISVPAHSGIHYRMTKQYDGLSEVGEHSETITIEDNNGNKTETICNFEIYEIPATLEEALAVLEKAKKQQEELKVLLDECHAKGITTDYESVAYNTFELFTGYLENEDIPRRDFDLIFYTERCLDEIYETAVTDLKAYLSNEKEPFTVPRYVTSPVEIDGFSTYATTDNHGKIEKRPVFFIGYGHFSGAYEAIPYFNEKFAINTVQIEAGTTTILGDAPEILGWNQMTSGNPSGSRGVDSNVVTEGNYSFKMAMQSPYADNYFYTAWQDVTVTPGKIYTLKGKVKAQNASCVYVSANNWDDKSMQEGTFDWRDFEVIYVAPAGKTRTTIRLGCYNTTEGAWFDDLSFTDNETGEELLVNGGLEKNNEIISFTPHTVEHSINILKNADENNIAMCVLISPHYFASNISKLYPELNRGFHFYNVNDPRVREIYERYIRVYIGAIKDYKSLKVICLTNEPQFHVEEYGDAYLQPWRDYLRKVYNHDINALNAAYRTDYTSFDDVGFTIDSTERVAINYDLDDFTTQEFARWHKWMTDIIHEIAPGIPVTTKNMGYAYDSIYSDLQNKGMNQQDYAEFLDVNGCDADNYLVRLIEPLRKMFWYDYMTGIKAAPVFNLEDHITMDNVKDYSVDNANYMTQDIWQGAVHGRAWTDIWAWQRDTLSPDFTYKDSCINYRPDSVYKISKASMDLNRLAYEITAIQNYPREVGVLYVDAATQYDTTAMHACYEFYAGAIYNGVKPHLIPDRQLEQMHNYKVIVVSQVTYAQKEVLEELKKYIDNGGRVIIYGKNSLKLDEHNLPNDEELVNYIYENSEVFDYVGEVRAGIVPGGEGAYEHMKQIFKEENIPHVDVIDATTGENAYKTEVNLGVYNGKLIINLVNYVEDRTVNIYVNGVKVEKAKELRDGLDYGENIILKKFIPILLQVDMGTPFIDTFNHWSKDTVKNLADKGIIKGVSESHFKPDDSISRAHFLLLLTRASGTELPEYNAENPEFRPNDKITREEMCEMLVKFYESSNGIIAHNNQISFSDIVGNAEIISKAVSVGLMEGRDDGTFDSFGNATRAEAATVIARYLLL